MDNISFRHTLVSAVPLGAFLILIFSLEFSEHVGLVHAGSLVKKKKKNVPVVFFKMDLHDEYGEKTPFDHLFTNEGGTCGDVVLCSALE